MNNSGRLYLKSRPAVRAFNKRLAVRNVVFVVLMSLLYVLAKRYKLAHNQPQHVIAKLKYLKIK